MSLLPTDSATRQRLLDIAIEAGMSQREFHRACMLVTSTILAHFFTETCNEATHEYLLAGRTILGILEATADPQPQTEREHDW